MAVAISVTFEIKFAKSFQNLQFLLAKFRILPGATITNSQELFPKNLENLEIFFD